MTQAPPPPPLPKQERADTQSAGQSHEESRGRIFPCDRCGADLKFDIGVQSLKCPYCGNETQIEIPEDKEVVEQDFRAMLERVREVHEKGRRDETGQRELTCEACGGTVVFVGSLTSSECPYCGSPVQLDKVHDAKHRIPVDGILPFLVDKKQAHANLKQWVKSRWFAPNEFKRRGADGKFNGVYLPFWTFDSLTFTRYHGERGEHYYVTVGTGDDKRRVRRTRWYPASGSFQRFFDDVLVLAARGMRSDMMHKLEPWPLARCAPFNQEMLAGYLARTYETSLEEGFADAKQRIDRALHREVVQRIGGDDQRVHSVRTHHGAITFKHMLLPTWLLAYKYKEKTYRVMINAATGEVQGERPWSWVKIGLAIAAVALLGIGAWFLFARG